MTHLPAHLAPDRWLAQIFASREAARGGVVKRQIRDVERLVGRDRFLAELDRRGFQAVRDNRHYVIFCHREPLLRVR